MAAGRRQRRAAQGPAHEDIARLLEAWKDRYSSLPGIEQAIVGAACSHHRLLWVHPFIDGNGRTARVHTHLVLTSLNLTQGLWSPMRGMARDREGYYARLNNADLPRRNDLDGRGPLSQEELVAFGAWLLDVCLDQARFMRGLLARDALKKRIADQLLWLAANPWRMGSGLGSEMSAVKPDALEALHYTAITGPIERARFMAMTGLPERTARRVLASLLDYGVLVADTTRAPVWLAIPLKSLRFLFPRLWPEADADVAPQRISCLRGIDLTVSTPPASSSTTTPPSAGRGTFLLAASMPSYTRIGAELGAIRWRGSQ
ncbi:MAG: Fic family protein [Casimicrobiaceae bacterium]